MKKSGYLDIFLTFAKIGGFTFGGGYAMLPMLKREVVDNNKWATEEELLDYYAVGQCTPGVIAVNVSTFIGYKLKGLGGAILGTLGVITPSFFIIVAVAAFLKNFAQNEYVMHALAGIKIAVAALILSAVVGLWKKGVKDIVGIVIFCIALAATFFFSLSPIISVVTAIVFGLLYGRFSPARKTAADAEKPQKDGQDGREEK